MNDTNKDAVHDGVRTHGLTTGEGERNRSAQAGLTRPVLVSAVLFMLVTGLGYPLVTTGIAQVLFPVQAAGSLVLKDGKTVGSAVIGQNVTRPDLFHPRPSATTGTAPNDPGQSVDQPYNAASSGASNLGPTSRKLMDQVAARVSAYRFENGLAADVAVPVDAVTASASGLDPDISPANAMMQAGRVAGARGVPVETIVEVIRRQTADRQFGALGEPRVNVLGLNLALESVPVRQSAAK